MATRARLCCAHASGYGHIRVARPPDRIAETREDRRESGAVGRVRCRARLGGGSAYREAPGGIVAIKARSTALTDSAVVKTWAMSGSSTIKRRPVGRTP